MENRVDPFQIQCGEWAISEQLQSEMGTVVTMFWDVTPCSFVNMYQSWYKLDAPSLNRKVTSLLDKKRQRVLPKRRCLPNFMVLYR